MVLQYQEENMSIFGSIVSAIFGGSKAAAGTTAAAPTSTGGSAPSAAAPSAAAAPTAPAVPVAGARFVRYAEKMSVSGVFQGNPARALVDGRIVRSGDMIEPVLGIKFVGVDSETKHLILQDASGAQLRVKY